MIDPFPDIGWAWFLAQFARTPPPTLPGFVIGIIVVSAVALSVPSMTWRYFGLFTTLVHELGHAFAALLTGRVVTGIRVHQNHAGSARSLGRGGISGVVTGFFGYPAPALVGAALVWSAFNGYTAPALLVGTAIIVLTIVFVRNAFGAVVVIAAAGVSCVILFIATAEAQAYALLILGVALLVGSVRALVTVIAVHAIRREQLATSDAWILARRTGIPSAVWLLMFTAVIGACVWFAAGAFAAVPG